MAYLGLLNKVLSELKEMADSSEDKAALKDKIIMVNYFNQYAEGVTGATMEISCYVGSDGAGFKTVKAAREAAKAAGLKNISRKGKPTPYGNIGAVRQTIKIMTIGEYLESAKASIVRIR